MDTPTITPRELASRHGGGGAIDLIDVRTPAEFAEVHIPFARNVPLPDLDPQRVAASRTNPAGPLYVVCKAGGRGRQACQKLVAAGLADVVNVDGGTQAWAAAGLPVVRGRKAISLERQVRIGAGLLVLAGSVAGFFYPPAIGLAAFVGAGLVFAGVTDTCGMGLMLARMPWNRGPAAQPAQECRV